MEELLIDHKPLEERFVQHLSDNRNRRILLTGPFGTGKSTFLNEIEETDIGKEKVDGENRQFVFLKIQPVNYSIASNDDIFELVKYDLLIELLDKYGSSINLQKEEFSLLLTVQMYINERFGGVRAIAPLINIATDLSSILDMPETISALIVLTSKLNKSAKSLWDQIKTYKDSVERSVDEKTLSKFMKEREQIGGFQSMDDVSFLIKKLINRIKIETKLDSISSVLIIDDMDRLDPDHIFRLFNIFSAHYDLKDDSNKFGFDKVIFVCDLENIKKIYYHRYGQGVDFTGYIDKFYSLEPFYFDNRRYITEKMAQILLKLPVNLQETVNAFQLQNRSDLVTMLTTVCIALIKERVLTLRMLATYPEFSNQATKINFGNNHIDYEIKFDFILMIQVLRRFYSSWQELSEKLHKLSRFDNKEAFRVLNRQLDFNIFSHMIAESCFPFLVLPGSELTKTTSGANVAITSGCDYHFQGTIEKPLRFESIKWHGDKVTPFNLIHMALVSVLDRGMFD